MTRANRRACRAWSQGAKMFSGKAAGYCEQCDSPIVSKGMGIYICTICGLEQPISPIKE